jgi:hypothetical protein
MKPRDIFKIIVATAGLIVFCSGAISLIDGLLLALGLSQTQHTQPVYYGARGVAEMIIGILLMMGIPPFVDLAFPLDQPPVDKSDEETENDV